MENDIYTSRAYSRPLSGAGEQAEKAFAVESNKREGIREHVPVLKSHTIYLGRWCDENEQEPTWRTRGNSLGPFQNAEGFEYADAAVFPRIPFPSFRNYGTCSRILGPFRIAEEQGHEYAHSVIEAECARSPMCANYGNLFQLPVYPYLCVPSYCLGND
jgi:hypothetical protein